MPEYEHTMVTNDTGEEVPGILFNRVYYELEFITASHIQFRDCATRINKICRGAANCANVPMNRSLFIDLEDFAKAFRKEVPPDVWCTASHLFATTLKQDRYGKSRFEQLMCARIDTWATRTTSRATWCQ